MTDETYIIKGNSNPCSWHKPMRLGYVATFLYADGTPQKPPEEQKQCPECGLWYFPKEYGRKPK